ncbi:MAG: signal peptide peptidase SppA, partial [Geminicoccaceae bacterium]
LGLTGVLIETPLLRGLLEKLGIEPVGDRRGEYKSAFETFTASSMSEAHRESLESLADSLEAQVTRAIAEDRAIDPARVPALIDGGPYLASEALDAKLVDRLSYWDEVVERAKSRAGPGSALVGLADYVAAAGPPPEGAPVIALIYGVGQITRGESSYGAGGWVLGADTLAQALFDAADDPDVRAVLLRIDSPGGSVVASETVGRAVRQVVARGKPVIASMADTAASGGYWIAMDASKIVAEGGTLTGSIGVFAGKPVLDQLWDKLGVAWGQVQRGANADMWSSLDDYDAAGRARLEAFLDRVYQAFTAGVARGRHLPPAEVAKAAQGRVWTGAQAKDLGLVDELGGFARALEIAKDAAGIAADQAVELRPFPTPRTPLQEALDLLGGSSLGLAGILELLRPGPLTAPPLAVR